MTSRKSERNQKWQIKAAKRNKNDFPPRLNIYIFFYNYKVALKFSYVPNNYTFAAFNRCQT